MSFLTTDLDAADRLPLLITGLAGVVGYNAFAYFKEKYPGQVFAQRREVYWPLEGESVLPFDLDNASKVRQAFEKHRFRSVLHCGGSCALKACEFDPSMAERVNIHSLMNLLDQIEPIETRLVALSIDLVFSGAKNGDYVEEDPTDPVTVYGKSMVVAEDLIADRKPSAAVMRISLPMGVSFNGHAGAIDWIQHRYIAGRPATLYYDEVRTPTYTDCMNPLLEHFLAGDQKGIFHTGGPRKLSLYEIAQIVNLVGGYPPELLTGCYRLEAGPMPPRAGNVTMNSSKLLSEVNAEPFVVWPLDDALVPTHRMWHFERERCPDGSAELLAEVLYRRPANL